MILYSVIEIKFLLFNVSADNLVAFQIISEDSR